MENAVRINNILAQITELDLDSKLYIAHELLDQISKKRDHLIIEKNEITDLKGLGKEVWKNIDVDEYIKNERAWD